MGKMPGVGALRHGVNGLPNPHGIAAAAEGMPPGRLCNQMKRHMSVWLKSAFLARQPPASFLTRPLAKLHLRPWWDAVHQSLAFLFSATCLVAINSEWSIP